MLRVTFWCLSITLPCKSGSTTIKMSSLVHHLWLAMAAIPPDLRDSSELPLTIKDPSDSNTTPGIRWNTTEDQFFLVVPQVNDSFMPTKRSLASLVCPNHLNHQILAPNSMETKTWLG